jgi:hypothetical protein
MWCFDHVTPKNWRERSKGAYNSPGLHSSTFGEFQKNWIQSKYIKELSNIAPMINEKWSGGHQLGAKESRNVWQLGNWRIGSVRFRSGRVGSGRFGSGRVGSGRNSRFWSTGLSFYMQLGLIKNDKKAFQNFYFSLNSEFCIPACILSVLLDFGRRTWNGREKTGWSRGLRFNNYVTLPKVAYLNIATWSFLISRMIRCWEKLRVINSTTSLHARQSPASISCQWRIFKKSIFQENHQNIPYFDLYTFLYFFGFHNLKN